MKLGMGTLCIGKDISHTKGAEYKFRFSLFVYYHGLYKILWKPVQISKGFAVGR